MLRKHCLWAIGVYVSCGLAVASGTLGRVVSIGGAAADLALDEARGYLYVANFTANRIEQMSLASNTIQTSINVPSQPSSLSLSPDGRYLVVAHYGNYAAPASSGNALTVIDLGSGGKQTFALGNPPLGVAFGVDGRALIITTAEFILFDPLTGTTQVLDTVSGVQAKTLPADPGGATFPANIVAASVAVSGDGTKMYGLTDQFMFSYNVTLQNLAVIGYVSSPTQGPRVVSVNRDGSYYTSGWTLNDRFGNLVAEFPSATGALNIGSHQFDSGRGLIYAQVPSTTATGSEPILQVLDADNLNVREQYYLPENLSGKSVLSSDSNTMYSVSDSGVLVIPVGRLNSAPRVSAQKEDVVFNGNFCDRRVASQQILITDPGGGNTPFSLSTTASGVTISPSSGTTPASVTISVDPNVFQNQKGTSTAVITLTSATAANLPPPIRVLVNMKDPDQRGTAVDVPGKLVDVLADPARKRFYVLRQDRNQVLVFDSTNSTQIATLRTTNVPTQMAITFDQRYLLVGSNDSQIIPVFDLETLQALSPIIMPGGHYPRSVAASAKAILAACRVAGPTHTVDRVDLNSRSATALPTLGVFKNDINVNTNLVATPNGSAILSAAADGTIMLYDANVDSFTVRRKDYSALNGAYAASSYNRYVVSNYLLNSSLVTVAKLESATGQSSGFAFVDQDGLRTTAPDAASPGVIQKVDVSTGTGISPTRLAEAPLLGDKTYAFTRTLAPLADRSGIISLTTSGFTILPWSYDASVAPPRISRVVNAADLGTSIAPGGLVSIFGTNMSPVNIATNEIPLPTALGNSCLTVNGLPIPLIFASPTQINAQVPFQATGNVTLIVRTPGGISDNYYLTIQPNAPGVFRAAVQGYESLIPTVVRAENATISTTSNPVHRGDVLTIYLTGMGQTSPAVETGQASPSSPLATVLTSPTVSLGGIGLPVSYAGLTPGQVGVYQINVAVPRNVPTGLSVPLSINQGSGTTSLQLRVVE
ncbi:MAG: hypothetical protein JSU00_17545 [Acidobacteria bacterium]|nr:hypothetical protein [Acidobacteriota bacterium]